MKKLEGNANDFIDEAIMGSHKIPRSAKVTVEWKEKEKKTIVRDLHIGGCIRIENWAQGSINAEIIQLPIGTKITIQYEE